MSSQGDRPRHDRAAGQHGSGLRAADKRVNMAGAHCVCDGAVYGMNEILRRRVKDSVILYSFGVCRYAWAFSKRMSRGTGCVNCARPGLWGSPSGNRGALPGKAGKLPSIFQVIFVPWPSCASSKRVLDSDFQGLRKSRSQSICRGGSTAVLAIDPSPTRLPRQV